MDFAIAIAEMDVDGFSFEAGYLLGGGVGKDEVADVDVCPDTRVSAGGAAALPSSHAPTDGYASCTWLCTVAR